MLVSRNKVYISMFIFVLYIILTTIISATHLDTNIVMALFLFAVIMLGYDEKTPIFSLNNLFIIVFFFVGTFFRYFVCLYIPDSFQEFSKIRLSDCTEYHMRTISFLFTSFIFFVFGKWLAPRIKIGNVIKPKREPNSIQELSNPRLLLFGYFVLLIFVYTYRFRYLVSSVSNDYNTLDFFVTILTLYLKFVAYLYLYYFFKNRSIFGLFIYSTYFVPQVALSLINAWKGTLIIEIIAIFILMKLCHVKIHFRVYALAGVVFFFLFYFITEYRVVLVHGGNISFDAENFIKYFTHDFFQQISERFEIYDLTYYLINSPKSMITYLRDNSPSIIESFFKSIIPRVLWPNKGVVNNLPVLIKQYFFGHAGIYSNSNVTFLGEAYISYGLSGTCMISLIYGWLCKKFSTSSGSSYSIAKSVLFEVLILQLYEGSISGKLIQILLTLIIVYAIKRLCFSSKTEEINTSKNKECFVVRE